MGMQEALDFLSETFGRISGFPVYLEGDPEPFASPVEGGLMSLSILSTAPQGTWEHRRQLNGAGELQEVQVGRVLLTVQVALEIKAPFRDGHRTIETILLALRRRSVLDGLRRLNMALVRAGTISDVDVVVNERGLYTSLAEVTIAYSVEDVDPGIPGGDWIETTVPDPAYVPEEES